MFCKKCGAGYLEYSIVCENCGALIEYDDDSSENFNENSDSSEFMADFYLKNPTGNKMGSMAEGSDSPDTDNLINIPDNNDINGNIYLDELPKLVKTPELQDDFYQLYKTSESISIGSDSGVLTEDSHSPNKDGKYDVFREMIGPGADYYIEAFKDIAKGRNRFNWKAFFFGGIIMLYRRMFDVFFKYYGLLITSALISGFLYTMDKTLANGQYLETIISLVSLSVCWIVTSLIVGHGFNRIYYKGLKEALRTHNQNSRTFVRPSFVPAFLMSFVLIFMLAASMFSGRVFVTNFGYLAADSGNYPKNRNGNAIADAGFMGDNIRNRGNPGYNDDQQSFDISDGDENSSNSHNRIANTLAETELVEIITPEELPKASVSVDTAKLKGFWYLNKDTFLEISDVSEEGFKFWLFGYDEEKLDHKEYVSGAQTAFNTDKTEAVWSNNDGYDFNFTFIDDGVFFDISNNSVPSYSGSKFSGVYKNSQQVLEILFNKHFIDNLLRGEVLDFGPNDCYDMNMSYSDMTKIKMRSLDQVNTPYGTQVKYNDNSFVYFNLVNNKLAEKELQLFYSGRVELNDFFSKNLGQARSILGDTIMEQYVSGNKSNPFNNKYVLMYGRGGVYSLILAYSGSTDDMKPVSVGIMRETFTDKFLRSNPLELANRRN